jgi:hypothetical protein
VDCGAAAAALEPPVILHAAAALHYTAQKPHGTTSEGDHEEFRSAQISAALRQRPHAGSSSHEVPALPPHRRHQPGLQRRRRSWLKRLQPVVIPTEQRPAAANLPKPMRTPGHPAPPATPTPRRFAHGVRKFANGWWGHHVE